jgi:glycosyltransferase involved in cell wall biosynthesis
VSTCHGFFNHKRFSRKLFPCWGEKTIASSKSVEKHLIEDFKLDRDRVVQIYNGIELDRFLNIGKEKDYVFLERIGFFSDDIIVGSIGRLSPVKGFKYLIEGFNMIARDYPKIKLLFIGEGPEENALRDMVSGYGLNTRVFFMGGGGMTDEYLPFFDIFCLPSVHEGLGLSIMEAMAAGKTCIASNVGGISELIQNDITGLLFPPRDPRSIAEAIKRLLGEPSLCGKLALNAREKAKKDFSICDSVRKTADMYEEVIKKGNGI